MNDSYIMGKPYIVSNVETEGRIAELKIAKKLFDEFTDIMKTREKEGLVFSMVRNLLKSKSTPYMGMTVEEKMQLIEEYRAKKEAEEYREPMTIEEYYQLLEEYNREHPSPGPEKPALF